MIKLLNRKKNRKKETGSTVRVRWTFLTMGVIFLTFSIFSYILLNTFQRVMLDSETDEMRNLSEELVTRFSNHYYRLTEEATTSMFVEPEIETGPIQTPKSRIDKREELATPVCLTKVGIIVKVYNPDEDLIYQTDTQSFRFLPSKEERVTEISGPYGKALSLVVPVHSTYNNRLLGYVQVIQTLKGYHEMTNDIRQSIIIIGIIALIFSSIIGGLLINSFVRPITNLTTAMESIQKNLDSDVRLNEGNKNNEFSKLAR